ncbi:MAG: efflux RND transporter periplasmic adaptor subunit [Candidatus Binatia bacterium]
MTSVEPGGEETRRADLASLRLDRDTFAKPAARPARRRILPIVLAVAVVGGFVLWRLVGRATPVTVVYSTSFPSGQSAPAAVLSGSGYVVTGERYVSIGVRVAGRIDRYFVEEGQRVRKGDPLVQLDDRDYRAAVARVTAGLAKARADAALTAADLRRGRALREQGIISQQELDVLVNKAAVAQATVTQLEAELAQARVNLDYTVLRSPTDGVVLAKLKEVGEIAVPGGFAGSGDLVRVANLTDMRAEVDVNEADLNRVRMDQAAEVTPDAYPDVHYAAKVVKLYPQVDRQKGTLKVEVHILEPDTRLLPDMSARITFLASPPPTGKAEKPVVLVPLAALRRDAQGNQFVWVVNGGRGHRVRVDTAGETGDQVRITRGVSAGEAVVVGNPPAREGQKVTVRASG